MKNILLLASILFVQLSYAQNTNIKRTWHWYFGLNSGLDFSSGSAVADTNGQLNTSEGCASISDTSGTLLFYTDGRTVWNHLHQVMLNGTGLLGGFNGSSAQEALIIPKPLSNNLYYLFTTDEEGSPNGMRYSIIDMNLDAGSGGVTLQKNVLLFAPCTEKLAAVNHCNDTNVWIVGHEINNNKFRAYLLSSNGIDTNSINSMAGFPMMSNQNGALRGVLKFSPNGKKLCTVSDSLLSRVQLFDFDNYTGIVSNSTTLALNDPLTFAICFSPDNTKLYTGKSFSELYQYNLSSNDSATIILSKILLNQLAGNGYRYMCNGPDGRTYISNTNQNDSLLSVINDPNVIGAGCNLSLFTIQLIKHSTRSGLPNFNESYFNQSSSNGCLTEISEQDNGSIKVYPNPARDWIMLEGKGIKSVEITNALGSKIGSYPTTAFVLQHKLNLSSLSRGIYFLKINMIDEQVVIQKLIVQN